MKPDQTIASIASRFDAAQTLHRQANLPQAVALYQQILREQPQHFGALHFLGVAAAQSNHPELAVELIGRSLQLNQSNAIAFNNHGNALHAAKRCGAAVESFDRAIALDKRYSDAYVNRALALIELGRCDEAIASCDKSIELAPRSVFAFIVRGMALRASGRFDEEMPNYCRAIEVDPAHAEAYYQRAMVSLLRGDLLEGWADYEWRWRIENRPIYKERRNFPQPLWLGREDLAGKTILIYTEQGFGDSIQFCRYVPMVAALGARVIFEVPKSLLSLFAKMEGIALILEKGAVLPEFDCHCPLMSLPLAFKTDRSNVPCFSKYLVCDAAKTERWRGKLGDSGKPKVGLVWSGSATHANDRNRSIPLMHWLNELPQNIHYISLQKDVRDSDMPALRSHPRIQNVASGELIDFSDTAALVECLDLVVSVDTSVAHLSGALGKPTWILLPFIPDWRCNCRPPRVRGTPRPNSSGRSRQAIGNQCWSASARRCGICHDGVRCVLRGGHMLIKVAPWIILVAFAGCAQLAPSKDSNAPVQCYTEPGAQSPGGCSVREGYPDCYLVCPDKGTRRKL